MERLRSARPWRVVAWVDGFQTWKHALKFERAWQMGFRGSSMRHVTQFQPSAGAMGKLQLLVPLMFHVRPWAYCTLRVHLVGSTGANGRMRAREVRWQSALEEAGVAFDVASDELAWHAWHPDGA